MKEVFKTKVTSTGGRNGKIISEDGVLDLDVRMPKSIGGEGGSYTNPEQLFAAGYSACFDSALNFIARAQKVKINSKVSASVSLLTSEKMDFGLAVSLDVEINGVDREIAQKLMETAHTTCPYSKAINNNVEVKLNLI